MIHTQYPRGLNFVPSTQAHPRGRSTQCFDFVQTLLLSTIVHFIFHLLACKILTFSFALPYSMRKRTQGNMDWPLQINTWHVNSFTTSCVIQWFEMSDQDTKQDQPLCESNKNFSQLLNQKLKIKNCHHHTVITPPLKAGMPLHSENWIIDSDWPTVASVNSTPLTSSQLQRAGPCVHCTRRGLINDLPAASPSNL